MYFYPLRSSIITSILYSSGARRLGQAHAKDRSGYDEVIDKIDLCLLVCGIHKDHHNSEEIAGDGEEGRKPEKVVEDSECPPETRRSRVEDHISSHYSLVIPGGLIPSVL